MINKLSIYPHPSFICTPLPSEGLGEASSYYQIIVYKIIINKLSISPHPSFICTPLPSEGLGGGFWEEAFLFYIFNVLPTSSCPIRHQLSMGHSVDKRSASPR